MHEIRNEIPATWFLETQFIQSKCSQSIHRPCKPSDRIRVTGCGVQQSNKKNFFLFYSLLPHSIETSEADVCLFVRDLKRGRKLDFEPTIKHYEQLLRTKKVTQPITIIPVNNFEMKLCASRLLKSNFSLLSLIDVGQSIVQ